MQTAFLIIFLMFFTIFLMAWNEKIIANTKTPHFYKSKLVNAKLTILPQSKLNCYVSHQILYVRTIESYFSFVDIMSTLIRWGSGFDDKKLST